MPNLLLHVSLGLILAHVLRAEKKSLLLFGSILPDIKIFVYALAIPLLGFSEATSLIIPIHTPFGSLLLAVFFASLLPKKEFPRTFAYLALGIAGHFVLDAAMFPVNGVEHYLLLYPLSWEACGMEAIDALYFFGLIGSSYLAICSANNFRVKYINRRFRK
ncbi:MAG: hypothetical protein JW724_06460 [Candidatus Altiarchaeota archaeon]|nr:hypothetical protein [Candidatus Altiarchaeota archaeon]